MSDTNQAPAAKSALMQRLTELATKHQTLLKYFIIGATASAIDVILFMVLYNLVGTSELIAHSISVPTAVLFSFIVNARHNFKTTDHTVLRLFSFVVVCTIGYAAGFAVIKFVMAQGLDANIGKILSLPVVFVLQYVLNSRITFYKPRPSEAAKGTT